MIGSSGLAAPILALLYLGLLRWKSSLALRVAREEGVLSGPRTALAGEGVAVAQAILSGDQRLGEVLAWNLGELPRAHFYWLVDDDDAEGLRICRELAARFPASRIEVLSFPPPPERCNPKLHKLEGARAAIGEPVLLVLDDDTRMPATTLAALLRALGGIDGSPSSESEGSARPRSSDLRGAPSPAADLATSLPGYLDDGRWPSRLLAQFVNNNAALTYLPLLAFRPALTLNGMAYALRTEHLAALGGFAPLLGTLTDDLAMAEAVLAAGGRIAQSAAPHWVETTVRDGRHYRQLLHRWHLFALLLLRKQPLGLRLTIGLLNGTGPLLLWALLASALFAWSPYTPLVVLATLVLRRHDLVRLQNALYRRPMHAPLTSLASELLQPFHLLHALLWRRIVWRKRRYRVQDDRHFEELR